MSRTRELVEQWMSTRESSRRPGADSFLQVVDVSEIINDKFLLFVLQL